MSVTTTILMFLVIIWTAIRTLSYAVWCYRNNNRLGSFVVTLVCLATVILPVYLTFFKM